MYLLYLDESGDPNSWQIQKHFVLAGVSVHEGQVYTLSQKLDAVQQKYFPGISYPIAFHATEIRRGKFHFKDFAPSDREQILGDLYAVIQQARFPNLIAFATVIHLSAAENPMQVRRDTLEDVCTRFNTFLLRQFRVGFPSKGLLIIDRNRAEEYRQLITHFQQAGVKYGYLGNIVDIPYFARCHETRMLQLADLCAYSVFRYYEHNDDGYLKMVLPRFDRRHINHPPDGFKHITKEPCNCLACSWRLGQKT